MLDILRIESHLKNLRGRILELEKNFKPLPEDKLIDDETLYNAAEHHLQIAIQNCLDVANYLVSALGLPAPKREASEVFFSLTKEEIISKKTAMVMKKIVGYRNVVVHDYLEVDRHLTYQNIQEGLEDLAFFAKEIEEFLEKKVKSVK